LRALGANACAPDRHDLRVCIVRVCAAGLLGALANQRGTEPSRAGDFVQKHQRLRTGCGYLGTVTTHITKQAATREIVAAQFRYVYHNASRHTLTNGRGPGKLHVVDYSTGKAADDLNAKLASVVTDLYAHHTAFRSIGQNLRSDRYRKVKNILTKFSASNQIEMTNARMAAALAFTGDLLKETKDKHPTSF
jgi:hypothetical protein